MTDPSTPSPNRKKLVQWILLGVAAVVLLVWFGSWVAYRMTHAVTNNAFVETDLVTLSPLVAGHVATIQRGEGDRVRRGDVLAVLDDRDYQAEAAVRESQLACAEQALVRARITAERVRGEVTQGVALAGRDVEQAGAGLDSAANALAVTRVQVEQARQAASAALGAARAGLDAVEKDYQRMETLYQRGSLEKRKYDQAVAQRAEFQARVAVAEADLAKAEAGLHQVTIAENQLQQARAAKAKSENGLALARIREKSALEADNAVRELEAQAVQARKALDAARLKLTHTRLTSPIDGVVAKKFVQAGDFVSPGFPVFAVYDQGDIYVTANLEESRFRQVRVGQAVDIDVDAFPGERFTGWVVEIGEAAGSKFALIPRDNSAGEFTKVVQRIPVKIRLERAGERRLLPGMSAEIGIRTGW